MTLKTLERPAITVVGMNIQTKPMSPEIPALWPKFVARIPEIPHPAAPAVSYGVMSHEAGTMSALQYMAAVAVVEPSPVPHGMHTLTIPAGTYAVFRYPLSGLAKGFGEIFTRLLPVSGFVQVSGPYYERYDESFDPGNAHSPVEICIPVRRRDAVVAP
jgi:AraC family transcriptional regulator